VDDGSFSVSDAAERGERLCGLQWNLTLNLPYPMVANIRLCECGKELQEGIVGGQHLLHCGSSSERNNSHHSLCDTMFYIMREAGYSPRREHSGVMLIRAGKTGVEDESQIK
jgi:hypothetical protein